MTQIAFSALVGFGVGVLSVNKNGVSSNTLANAACDMAGVFLGLSDSLREPIEGRAGNAWGYLISSGLIPWIAGRAIVHALNGRLHVIDQGLVCVATAAVAKFVEHRICKEPLSSRGGDTCHAIAMTMYLAGAGLLTGAVPYFS